MQDRDSRLDASGHKRIVCPRATDQWCHGSHHTGYWYCRTDAGDLLGVCAGRGSSSFTRNGKLELLSSSRQHERYVGDETPAATARRQLGRTPPHGMPKTESEISTRVSSMNLATPRRIVFWHSTTKASKRSGRSNWSAYLARYCCMYVSTRLSASR